ncbi:PEP-CTERM sorting domain-containing protein [Variovorax sp. HJSM1_2]|uniref:PEP-CTERM sorting domain-containing protein n=1 Tax=Variovorax sp. HJSM1_2 TaxID=3366263 RepID=UPI003BBBF7C1
MKLFASGLPSKSVRIFAIAAAWAGMSVSAQATTLAYNGMAYGSEVVALSNTSPSYNSTVNAGEMRFVRDDAGVISSILAYCVDIFQPATSSAQQYTLVDGLSYFGTQKSDALGRLFTEFDIWNAGTSVTAHESAAMQLAVWEIVNETAAVGGKASYNLSDGNFSAIGATSGTVALAQGWLDGLETTHDNWYSVSAYKNASFQDYLALNRVPEPGSVALMFAGLAALGFTSRRRKTAKA